MIFTILLFIQASTAADSVAVPPVSEPAAINASQVYELEGLHSVGFTEYNMPEISTLRQYMKFENADGIHTIVYDEIVTVPVLKTLNDLRQAMSSKDSLFSLEIECANQAFCTGGCKNMYYEFTNGSNESSLSGHNRCVVRNFSFVHLPTQTNAANAAAIPKVDKN